MCIFSSYCFSSSLDQINSNIDKFCKIRPQLGKIQFGIHGDHVVFIFSGRHLGPRIYHPLCSWRLGVIITYHYVQNTSLGKFLHTSKIEFQEFIFHYNNSDKVFSQEVTALTGQAIGEASGKTLFKKKFRARTPLEQWLELVWNGLGIWGLKWNKMRSCKMLRPPATLTNNLWCFLNP